MISISTNLKYFQKLIIKWTKYIIKEIQSSFDISPKSKLFIHMLKNWFKNIMEETEPYCWVGKSDQNDKTDEPDPNMISKIRQKLQPNSIFKNQNQGGRSWNLYSFLIHENGSLQMIFDFWKKVRCFMLLTLKKWFNMEKLHIFTNMLRPFCLCGKELWYFAKNRRSERERRFG